DSHDDNIMLRQDGSLFRVDFGYVFGQSPALDAPPTVVPNAVLVALGEARWKEVCIVCERALMALSTPGEFVGFACVRSVPEMALLHHQAHAYAQGLTLEGFREEVRASTEWSAARAAKNRLREVVRYVRRTEEEEPSPTPRSLAAPARSVRELRELRWLRPAEGDDEPVLFEEDEDPPAALSSDLLGLPERLPGLEDPIRDGSEHEEDLTISL
ncbi:Phosphatidylinositol 3-kinase, partial [Durusdinium trenchii]